jgi:DNA end-binding protein Ku
MWSGAISFGLVTVPVKVYTAATSRDVHFNQLHATDNSRLRQERICIAEDKPVPFDELVKGYEVAKDAYVIIKPEELEALAPEGSRHIELQEFVDLAEIDPVFFERSYYLVPEKIGQKPYALLLAAMRDAQRVGIGKVVLRSKQYLTAIRPAGDALAMSTLYYADEVTSTSSLDGLPAADYVLNEREMTMARQLIDALSAPFEPEKYEDEYRAAILRLVEQKAAGEEPVIQSAPREDQKVVDLMAALEASIAAARGSEVVAAGG